jgi:L-ascorbate metabolism protein UlaG (beta-lactamase superfamily)
MVLIIIVLVILCFVLMVYLYMQRSQFGSTASGQALEKIKASPNFKNGQFQNLSHTPSLTEGASYAGIMREFFFGKSKRSKPFNVLPSKKTNLFTLDAKENVLIWFGHSSYFMQVDGKKILVDPVLSGHASPLSFTTKSFKGSDVYTVDDIPSIDYLFISHDHYDHLDYETVVRLKPKIGKVITGLGVAAHLERWGYDLHMITESDWGEEHLLGDGFIVNTTPARHFSGRGFKRNGSLWLSFVLATPTTKIFIGGDSGYDTHFASIGNRYGPFDLAILENGQYNKSWKYIHMMPEEVVQAAEDLKAKVLFPVHWSKFSLAIHAWDDPIIRATAEAKRKGMTIVHPMIGEALHINEPVRSDEWWLHVR